MAGLGRKVAPWQHLGGAWFDDRPKMERSHFSAPPYLSVNAAGGTGWVD